MPAKRLSAAFPSRRLAAPRLSPLCLAVAAALAPAQALWAQESPKPAEEAGKLTTVTVTAERRAESVLTVPMAVSTLRGETLDVLNSSGEDLRMLSGRVPSLNIESSFGRAFPRFYIRGYGNTDFRLNASQPVSLILDDVVQENPILKGFPIFDVEGVEVLAGPQGTLFGRNTPAGVVKIDSVKPQKTFGGYASISYGSYDTLNLEGALNVPLSDQWQARFSLQSQSRDDWVTNEAPEAVQQTHKLEGYKDNAARAQFLYGAGTPFTALFNVHARDLTGSARLFRANIIQAGTNDLVDDFDIKKVYIDGQNEQKLTSMGANAHLTWALPGAKLHSITGFETVHSYSRGDVDGGYGASFLPESGPGLILFPSETADGLSGHRQFSQELRMESATAGPLSWQGGLYFFRETFDMDAYNYDSTAGGALTSSNTTTQSNNAYAAFGSVNYALASDLSLRAGLRYTHDKKKLSTDPGTVAVDDSEGLSDEVSSSKVTGDVALSWMLDKNTNLYGRVATGVRGASILPASGFNPLSQAEPETSISYEVGVKTELPDRTARFTANVFHYDVKHQQLTVVGGATGNSTVLASAKKAMGQGVEFTMDAYLTENLLLGLNGSINTTKIKDKNLVVSGCAQCTVTDPTITNADGATGYSINGNPLPQAPKYVANANLRYSIPTADGEFYAYTDWTYRSKVNFFLYESVEFTGKPLTTGGLRLGYIWDNGKYELAAFGRNITNKVQVTGAIDFNNLTGFVNEPRTWGAQFRANF